MRRLGLSPRVWGNPAAARASASVCSGLSPRVWGNRAASSRCAGDMGSIPTGVGEPEIDNEGRTARWVYPHGCGGTSPRPRASGGRQGLSPRVWGNLTAEIASIEHGGSIPTSAGEPSAPPKVWRRARVYPHECGGTRPPGGRRIRGKGLSPRVRGNRDYDTLEPDGTWSIPTSAGEPGRRTGAKTRSWVYPHECGGT